MQTLILSRQELLFLIEESRNLEICGDLSSIKNLLSPIWESSTFQPDFSEYETVIQAELYRICGAYLSSYGNQHNLDNYQINGKDLLSKSARLFEEVNLFNKAAEAKVKLAFCYWNSGEVDEFEYLLKMVEEEFGDNPLHPVFSQIRINQLMSLFWNAKYDEAINLIENVNEQMQFCIDSKLQSQYHTQAGIIYRKSGKYIESNYHFNEAYRFINKTGNLKFLAIHYNNYALLQWNIGKIKLAHQNLEKSIDLCIQTNYVWLLPHVLDSKALIYIDEKNFSEALNSINEAIGIFKQGEDARSLVDSLWTKCVCLAKLSRKKECLRTYIELQAIASQKIGEIAVEKYEKLFCDQIHFVTDLPLDEKVADFRRELVRDAVIKAKEISPKSVTKTAAEILKIKRGKLTDILINQYPEIRIESGYKKRHRTVSRTVKILNPPKKRKTVILTPSNIRSEKITKFKMPETTCYEFEFNYRSSTVEPYFISAKDMQKFFGIDHEALVLTVPIYGLIENDIVIILHENNFMVGKVRLDFWNGIECFVTENPDDPSFPIILDESNIIGKPVGFTEYRRQIEKSYTFRELRI